MSELFESLASITGQRDRDVLDLSVLGLMNDLLHPRALAIHRAIGDGSSQRWLTRPRLNASGQDACDALPEDLNELPRLDMFPQRRTCLDEARTLSVPGHPHALLIPLSTDREVIGVLEITTDSPMADSQIKVVDSLQRFYRHLRGLLDENERDSLTGLLNRKSFDETFVRAAMRTLPEDTLPSNDPGRRQAQAQAPHWLAVVDIDHFKRVNDNHGHLIGDEVLLLLSGLMRSTFRYDDRLYRFGGEEFVVLTRGIAAEDAHAAFERLRAHVQAFAFPQVGQLTVSVGYTAVAEDDTPSSAVERADQALYHAKQHGRNQALEYDQLVACGALKQQEASGDIEFF